MLRAMGVSFWRLRWVRLFFEVYIESRLSAWAAPAFLKVDR
jgi:hypothetical protein